MEEQFPQELVDRVSRRLAGMMGRRWPDPQATLMAMAAIKEVIRPDVPVFRLRDGANLGQLPGTDEENEGSSAASETRPQP